MAKRQTGRRTWRQFPVTHLALAKLVATSDLPFRDGPYSYSDAQVYRYTFNAFREALRVSSQEEADKLLSEEYPNRRPPKLSQAAAMYNILQDLIVRVVRDEKDQCHVEIDLHPTSRAMHKRDPDLAQAFTNARAAFARDAEIPSGDALQ